MEIAIKLLLSINNINNYLVLIYRVIKITQKRLILENYEKRLFGRIIYKIDLGPIWLKDFGDVKEKIAKQNNLVILISLLQQCFEGKFPHSYLDFHPPIHPAKQEENFKAFSFIKRK